MRWNLDPRNASPSCPGFAPVSGCWRPFGAVLVFLLELSVEGIREGVRWQTGGWATGAGALAACNLYTLHAWAAGALGAAVVCGGWKSREPLAGQIAKLAGAPLKNVGVDWGQALPLVAAPMLCYIASHSHAYALRMDRGPPSSATALKKRPRPWRANYGPLSPRHLLDVSAAWRRQCPAYNLAASPQLDCLSAAALALGPALHPRAIFSRMRRSRFLALWLGAMLLRGPSLAWRVEAPQAQPLHPGRSSPGPWPWPGPPGTLGRPGWRPLFKGGWPSGGAGPWGLGRAAQQCRLQRLRSFWAPWGGLCRHLARLQPLRHGGGPPRAARKRGQRGTSASSLLPQEYPFSRHRTGLAVSCNTSCGPSGKSADPCS